MKKRVVLAFGGRRRLIGRSLADGSLRIDRRRRDSFGRWRLDRFLRSIRRGGLRLLDPRNLAGLEIDGHRLVARLRMPYLRRLYHEGAPLIPVETIDAGTPPQRRLVQSGEISRKRGRVMTRLGARSSNMAFSSGVSAASTLPVATAASSLAMRGEMQMNAVSRKIVPARGDTSRARHAAPFAE